MTDARTLAAQVAEERRIRRFTIPMLRAEFGDDWPRREAEIRRTADEAADALARRVQALEEAAEDLLADDDMPNHWVGCVCSYCVRYRRLEALLSEAPEEAGR